MKQRRTEADQTETAFLEALRARGLTYNQAARICQVSERLIAILAKGGVTLPTLAMQIGRALRLTVDEVRPLGQALGRERFQRETGVTPHPVDCDPEWWRHYRPDRQPMINAGDVYLDGKKLMEQLLRMDADPSVIEEITGKRFAREINRERRETRIELISRLEGALGMAEGELRTDKPGGLSPEMVFMADEQAIRRQLNEREMTAAELSQAIGITPGTMSTILTRAKKGLTMEMRTAKAIAGALGVSLDKLGRKIIREKKAGWT